MKYKLLVAAVVALMLAVPLATMYGNDTDATSGSTVSHGEFDIYVMTDTTTGIPSNSELTGISSSWIEFQVDGYDACEAVIAFNQQLALSSQTYAIDDTYNTYTGSYYTVDSSYGQIDEMLNLSETGTLSWHAWVYTFTGEDEEENTIWEWTELSSTSGLGHYRPFNDYSTETYQTANIAVFYGTDAEAAALTMPTSPDQSLVDVSAMRTNQVEDYQITFTLVNANADPDVTYVSSVVAYGSDVYAALKDLCANNNLGAPVGSDTAGEYYSWITSINYLANATSSPWTPYWAFYDATSGSNVYASYTMGFYSSLDNGYNYSDTVYLEFA